MPISLFHGLRQYNANYLGSVRDRAGLGMSVMGEVVTAPRKAQRMEKTGTRVVINIVMDD